MTEQVEQSANDTVISEILELNPELEGIGNYEYGWADSDEAGGVGIWRVGGQGVRRGGGATV